MLLCIIIIISSSTITISSSSSSSSMFIIIIYVYIKERQLLRLKALYQKYKGEDGKVHRKKHNNNNDITTRIYKDMNKNKHNRNLNNETNTRAKTARAIYGVCYHFNSLRLKSSQTCKATVCLQHVVVCLFQVKS